MPSLPFDQATLEEVLEVRGEPLYEEELWALVMEGVNALRSVLSKGERDERLYHLAHTLRPDTILLCLNGRIRFAITKHVKTDPRFVPPETYSAKSKSKSNIEKMLIYSLGMAVLSAAENGESVKFQLDRNLDALLCNMVEDSYYMRSSISEIIQVCLEHIDSTTCYIKIKSMAAEIVGPYGLEPLTANTELILPQIPTKSLTNGDNKENYPFDPGPTSHIQPMEALKPVTSSKEKGITIDITDHGGRPMLNSHDPNSWDIPKQQANSPSTRHPLSPRSLNMDGGRMTNFPKPDVVGTPEKLSEAKAWSPTYSSPDFKVLMDLEHKKLAEDGYTRDVPRMISPSKNYRSMPALNNMAEQQSPPLNHQYKHKIKETPVGLPRYKSASFIADSTSIHTPTSQYSSQISLTHGAYVLDADSNWGQTLKRFGSGSTISQYSDDGSKYFTTLQPQQYRPIELPHLGPEFIRISADPDTAFVDITPPRLGPLPKGTRPVSVFLPNTQKVQTNVQVNSKGKELFDQIVVYLGLKETVYFGLTEIKDEEHLFLDLDTKLTKYAPAGWKDENPKKRKIEFILHFKVKFFVENPSALKHNLTAHLYYIQLRQDLLSGYTHCPDETLLLLTSYALQAEYGPFEPEYHATEYFRIESYLPGRVLSRMSRLELLRKLPLMHQSHNALESHAAEAGFLEEAKKLPEYGVIFHKVSRSKKIETDIVWLGICVKGIIILEPKGKQRAAVHKQEWNLIKEFNFEKKKFLIKPKNPEEHPKMVFYTNHYRRSKYLFKMCQSFHRFQIFNETRTSSKPTMQGSLVKKDVKENKQYFEDKKADVNQQQNIDREKKIVLVNLLKTSKEGLGITIVGGEDSNRISQGIFIKKIKPGSLCAKDGRLNEGDKIISVNGHSLETASHDEAVNVLRNAGNEIELIVSKMVGNASILDVTGLSPTMNHSQLIREDQQKWTSTQKSEHHADLKEKLSGIDFIDDDDEEEDQFSERPIDVPNTKKVPKDNSVDKDVASREGPHTRNEMSADPAGSPRGMFLVNDVEINHDEDSFYSETEDSFSEQNTTLKRFGAFEDLDKIDSLDQPDFIHNMFKKNSVEKENNLRQHEVDVVQSVPGDHVGGDMNETIEEIEVEIRREKGSYGFSIMGGIESSLPLGGIYIRSLQNNGTAKATGKIRTGDRLLSINGVSLEHVSHKEAVETIQNAPLSTSVIIDRGIEISPEYLAAVSPVVNKFQSLKAEHSKQHVFEEEIGKVNDGIGLSLAGGKDSDIVYQGLLMIRKLFPAQPMEQSGKFCVGDVILAINDQIVEGMTLQEALGVIRTASKTVKIIAKRPNRSDIPEELFVHSRPVSPEKLLQDFHKKDMQVDGRGSREGNRIAKQLLQAMAYNDSDDSADGFSFSEGLSNDENDVNDDEILVLPPKPTQPKSNKIEKNIPRELNILPMNKKTKAVSDNIPLATSTPSPRSLLDVVDCMQLNMDVETKEGQGERERHRNQFGNVNEEDSQSRTDSDSPLGYRRHRPSNQKHDHDIKLDNLKGASNVLYLVKDEQGRHGLLFENIKHQLVVKEVLKDQPADLQQAFQKGLVIKSINDHSTQSFTPQMADALIASLDSRVKFNVEPALMTEQVQEAVVEKDTSFSTEKVPTDHQNSNNPYLNLNGTTSLGVTSPPVGVFRAVPSSPVLKRLDMSSRSPSHDSGSRRVSSSSVTSSTGEVILVQLEKGSKGLGITLGSGNDIDSDYVFIKKIVPGSVAEENGQLRIRDRLICINGENVEDSTQKEIVARFRRLSGTVALECYRPPDNISPTHKSRLSPAKTSSMNPLKLPTLPAPLVNQSQQKGIKITKNHFELNKLNGESKMENHGEKMSETIFSSSRAAFDFSAGSSNTNSSSTMSSDENDAYAELNTAPAFHPRRDIRHIRDMKQMLSPIESASTTLEMTAMEENHKKEEQIVQDEKTEFDTANEFNIADLVIPPPPPPQLPDDVGWSSDDELNSHSLDFSLPGMDVNGVLRPSSSSNSLDNEKEDKTVAKKINSNIATKSNENISASPASKEKTGSPANVVSRPPSGASSSQSTRSGIPRLIRSRSNSLSSENSSRCPSRKQSIESQNVISADVSSKDGNPSTQDHFVERKNFVFYTKDRISKLIKSIDTKMENLQINSEFMTLRQVKTTSTCDVGNRACNRGKNRNKTILPYDDNRIVLTGGEETDYINASLIKIPIEGRTLDYIVTQAPLESTVTDFWRCIWEQKVELVVMLTKQIEGGKAKCYQYWPNATASPMKIMDKFEIELLYEEDNGSFVYRQIQLRNSRMDKSLFITQVAFTSWPDNGVPKDVIEFLGFMKFAQNFRSSSPTLVHCSSGVGRSGAYVVIDSVWNAIEYDVMFDVSKITKLGKEQRQLLIQTKEQYQFCYRVIRELLDDIPW